jgi:ATP-dependent Clp protease protease subunit
MKRFNVDKRRIRVIKPKSSVNIPNVIEKDGTSDRTYDIYSRLLKDRIIFLSGELDDELGSAIVAQLLFLDKADHDAEISFYIMSNGGGLFPALAIYDTMKYISCPIATYCIGYAYSAGAFLLSSGTAGRRFALPSSRIMVHNPWQSGSGGGAEDLRIEAEQAETSKHLLLKYLSENTKRTVAEWEKLLVRDKYFVAPEAKAFGLIDKVVSRKKR